MPFNAPRKYWNLYQQEDIKLASNPFRSENLPKQVSSSGEIKGYGKFSSFKDEKFQRNAKHGYYACISFIDAQIGLILDELERLELVENTIIVVLGDHGWHLGEHGFWGKHNLMNHSTRSPLLVYVPHSKGGRAKGIVEFVDIYPTLCELCGIPFPGDQLQGKSFAPILRNAKKRIKEYAFVQWNGGYNVVSERYSTALWFDNDSVVASMFFDRKEDAAENINRAAGTGCIEKTLRKQKDYLLVEKDKLDNLKME